MRVARFNNLSVQPSCNFFSKLLFAIIKVLSSKIIEFGRKMVGWPLCPSGVLSVLMLPFCYLYFENSCNMYVRHYWFLANIWSFCSHYVQCHYIIPSLSHGHFVILIVSHFLITPSLSHGHYHTVTISHRQYQTVISLS